MSEAKRLCGVEAPVPLLLTLCEKFAFGLLGKGLYKEFATSLRPWRFDGEGTFSLQEPYFSTLIADRCADDASLEELCATKLKEAFFSNTICDVLAEPIGSGKGTAFATSEKILMQYEQFELDEDLVLSVPDQCVKSMDLVLTVCRAIVAVSCSVPGMHQSSYEDVVRALQAGRQSGGEADGADDETKDAFDHIRTAALPNSHWRARTNAYMTLGIADAAIAGPYHSLAKEHRGASDDLAASVEIVKETIARCEEWQKKLRVGGCQMLFDGLAAWVQKAHTAVVGGTVSVDMVKDVCTASSRSIALIDPRDRNQELRTIKREMDERIASSVGQAAQHQVCALVADLGRVGQVLDDGSFADALRACKSVTLSEDLARLAIEYRGHIFSHALEMVRAADLKPNTWGASLLAIDTIVELMGEINSERGSLTDAMWATLREVSTEIMDMKDCTAQLEDAAEMSEEEKQVVLEAVLTASAALKSRVDQNTECDGLVKVA